MNNVLNRSIITSGDMSGSINSSPQELAFSCAYAIQGVFTGSPVGTFKLQESVDPVTSGIPLPSPTNWTDVDGSSRAISAAGDIMWNYNGGITGATWVRAVYTRTSGTGTLNMRINTKG